MSIFANILASVLPRSRKSGIWQLLCLDIVSINVYKNKTAHMVKKTCGNFHMFTFFCFGIALVKDKYHFASVEPRSCQYLSVCQKLSKIVNYSERLNAIAIFAKLPRTDGHTDSKSGYRTFFESETFSRSIFLQVMQRRARALRLHAMFTWSVWYDNSYMVLMVKIDWLTAVYTFYLRHWLY